MYIPKAFEVNDLAKIFEFIKSHSFGILLSQEENGPFATHLPFLLDEKKGEQGVLVSHMAMANPHWKDLHNKEVLVVFPGPHTYISSTWYNDENTVPTWNYVAVHVYGTVRMIERKEELVDLLDKTVDFYEAEMPNPLKTQFDNKYVDGLMNGIVGFEVIINKIEGKWKLNQNHSVERQQNVVNGLKKSNQYDSVEIARLMEENINGKDGKHQ